MYNNKGHALQHVNKEQADKPQVAEPCRFSLVRRPLLTRAMPP
jgi:hypothetical protein